MSDQLSLAQLLDQLDELPDELTIYVCETNDLLPTTTAIARDEGDGSPAPGMRYLLEVALAKDAIKTWSAWRHGRPPSSQEKVEAVIYYAEHDAYLPTE